MTKQVPAPVWEDPPEKVMYDWPAIARRTRSRPGKWLKVFDEDRTSLATALRAGAVKVLDPALGFEVRTANNTRHGNPRTCTLYVRYKGEKVKG